MTDDEIETKAIALLETYVMNPEALAMQKLAGAILLASLVIAKRLDERNR